jgi:DNA-3-methyladenine glycosylase II
MDTEGRSFAEMTVRFKENSPEAAAVELQRGFTEVARLDPDMKRVLSEVGEPDVTLRPRGFAMFLRGIIAQQVSVKAAASIYGRVEDKAGQPVTAEKIQKLGVMGCRELGMSQRKAEYALGLAEAELRGQIDFGDLEQMPDEEAIARLVELRGIGRWTAEVYLLLSLGRPNIWPAADLALMNAIGRIKKLENRPTIGQATDIAELWKPWRGSAALLLWHYYKKMPA